MAFFLITTFVLSLPSLLSVNVTSMWNTAGSYVIPVAPALYSVTSYTNVLESNPFKSAKSYVKSLKIVNTPEVSFVAVVATPFIGALSKPLILNVNVPAPNSLPVNTFLPFSEIAVPSLASYVFFHVKVSPVFSIANVPSPFSVTLRVIVLTLGS